MLVTNPDWATGAATALEPTEEEEEVAEEEAPFAPRLCNDESGTVSLLTRNTRVDVSPRLEPLMAAALLRKRHKQQIRESAFLTRNNSLFTAENKPNA